jgi:hypothetical protein
MPFMALNAVPPISKNNAQYEAAAIETAIGKTTAATTRKVNFSRLDRCILMESKPSVGHSARPLKSFDA